MSPAPNMSFKRRSKHYAMVTVMALVLLIVGVVIYRHLKHTNSYLPHGTRIGALDMSGVSRNTLETKLDELSQNLPLTINTPEGIVRAKMIDAGLSINSSSIAAEANQLSPGELILTLPNPKKINLRYTVDSTKLAAFALNFTTAHSHAATKTSFNFANGKITSKPGYTALNYEPSSLIKQLQAQAQSGTIVAILKPANARPTIGSDQLEAFTKRFQNRVDIPLSVQVNGAIYSSTPEDRYTWQVVSEPETNGSLTLGYNEIAIKSFVDSVAKKVYQSPTANTITTLDHIETSRQVGVGGQALNSANLVASIKQALEAGTAATIAASTHPLPSPLSYVRNYSHTNVGLNLLITDFASEHKAQFGIVVQEVGGSRQAAYNSNAKFVTASVFKAFLAYAVLRGVADGQWSMATGTTSGLSVEAAINKMIHVSDNATAYSLHQLYGFGNIDPFLASRGFTSTHLNNYTSAGILNGDKTTTPQDVASLFRGLANNSLLPEGDNKYLLNLMQNQIYRSGIPAGSKPAVVADKVGFLDAWIHDAGIVYGSNSTYVLVVMTRGGTWGDIADLSKRIYANMN